MVSGLVGASVYCVWRLGRLGARFLCRVGPSGCFLRLRNPTHRLEEPPHLVNPADVSRDLPPRVILQSGRLRLDRFPARVPGFTVGQVDFKMRQRTGEGRGDGRLFLWTRCHADEDNTNRS